MNLTPIAAAAPLAWLLPNHYLPWLAAWSDGLVLALLAMSALLSLRAAGVQRAWFLAIGLGLASVAGQWLSGRILFGGDAVMAALYLVALGLALVVGQLMAADGRAPGRSARSSADSGVSGAVAALAIVTALAAALSAAIAVVQWLGLGSGSIWRADLPPGARPFANVAQPNHLCTLSFLGLCALALLERSGRLPRAAFWLLAPTTLFTMAMTGSRTGWLQMAGLVLLALFWHRRGVAAMSPRRALVLAALFVVFTLAWPLLNDVSGTRGDRDIAVALSSGGGRGLLWPTLLDAISRQWLGGWGWQQISMAQLGVAVDHPAVMRQFEYSHNLVLDLLLWAGVPVGATMLLLMAVSFGRRLWFVTHPGAAMLLAGAAGVVLHALVEYPHGYAYFLVPFGLAVGAARALEARPLAHTTPVWLLPAVGAMFAGALAVVAVDYLRAEQSYRILRLETARIGTSRVESVAPDLRALSQLEAFLRFARTDVRAGLADAEFEELRRTAERFPMPPALYRLALAAGLNGRPDLARLTLNRLCRMHSAQRCDEGRAAWQAAQDRHAVLRAVPFPTAP